MHPLVASAVKAAARDTGATAEGKDSLKRDKYSLTGTGACRFVPLSHETFGRAGPAAFALLNEIAEFVASSGVVSERIFLENAMHDLSTTLCRGITRQVLATIADSSRGASCLLLRPHLRQVVTLCVCRYWVATRLVTGCARPRPCVRETCMRRLDAAWGVAVCKIILSFVRVCRVGVFR